MSKGKLVALTSLNIGWLLIYQWPENIMKVKLNFLQEADDLDFLEKSFYCRLGVRIRAYRQTKNLSQTYMSAKLKISQTAYSKIEAGKSSCSVYRLTQILEVLDLDPKHLLIVRAKQEFDMEDQ